LGYQVRREDCCAQGIGWTLQDLPDVHYGEETHYVAGDAGISNWTVTGTSSAGQKVRANGFDFYTFP
jgi:hypothetical protein